MIQVAPSPVEQTFSLDELIVSKTDLKGYYRPPTLPQ